ncbi:MAG: ABC transporter permease [Vicinamibacterales bacterium]
MSEFVRAFRRLRATPVFTAFAVASLALGLGVTTAAYSVIHTMLWQSVGIADEDTLVFVDRYPSTLSSVRDSMSVGDLADLERDQRSFAGLAAWAPVGGNLRHGAATEFVVMDAVNGGYFGTLGVRAARGRVIGPADADRGAAAVVVLQEQFWRRRLAADPAIVGRTVTIGDVPFTVIGIAPAGFRGLVEGGFGGADAWIPLAAAGRLSGPLVPAGLLSSDRDRRPLTVAARLRPATSIEAAGAELRVIGAGLDAAYPLHQRLSGGGTIGIPREWSARPAGDVLSGVTGPTSGLGLAMILLVALVLLVACTNLANLMLARGALRQVDVAVQRALGASRWHLVRTPFVEAVLIAIAGGAAALAVTRVLLTLATTDLPISAGRVIAFEPRLNVPVLAAAALALVLSLVVFGLWPAWRLATTASAPTGHDASPAGATRWRTGRSLISWQVAVSAGFFLMAALCVRALDASGGYRPGSDLEQLAVAQVQFDEAGMTTSSIAQEAAAVLGALERHRQTDKAAVMAGVPLGWPRRVPGVQVSAAAAGTPEASASKDLFVPLVAATDGVFDVVGVSLEAGRPFDERDGAGSDPVVVMSESAARAIFAAPDPRAVVGRPIVFGDVGPGGAIRAARPATVIGIVSDLDVDADDKPLLYVPLAQRPSGRMQVVAHAIGDPERAVAAVRASVRAAVPDALVTVAGSGLVVLAPAYAVFRHVPRIALALGALALVLAMVGLYGVLSQLVTARAREMGVRLALGATPRQIRRLVVREGFRPVIDGVVLGLIAGGLGRLLLIPLFSQPLSLVDPLVFVLAPLPLVVAALVACALPAWRAARVEPNVALRDL